MSMIISEQNKLKEICSSKLVHFFQISSNSNGKVNIYFSIVFYDKD